MICVKGCPSVMAVICAVPVPAFCRVIFCAGLVEPMNCGENCSEVGKAETRGPTFPSPLGDLEILKVSGLLLALVVIVTVLVVSVAPPGEAP